MYKRGNSGVCSYSVQGSLLSSYTQPIEDLICIPSGSSGGLSQMRTVRYTFETSSPLYVRIISRVYYITGVRPFIRM